MRCCRQNRCGRNKMITVKINRISANGRYNFKQGRKFTGAAGHAFVSSQSWNMRNSRLPDIAQGYAVRLMHDLVIPTFVLDARRRVVIWNRACERLTGVDRSEVLGTMNHWRAFYPHRRYCLADLVALQRPEKLSKLYAEY